MLNYRRSRRTWVCGVRDLRLETKIEVARGLMDESARLMAHEEYFDDIDEELRKLIRLAQHLPCGVGLDSWEEMREFLAHGDDVFLRLVSWLPLRRYKK
jgi:hypothetical protein